MTATLGGSGRMMSEINVTPMVDVMLVLLIIFMVTAPLIQQGVAVKLPQTKAQTLETREDRMVVILSRERRIFIGDTEVPYATLRSRMEGNVKLGRDKEVYLHADRDLAYGFVVDVMAILKDAGVENMGLVTEPTAQP
jgi:biopolymer transport protein TolR